MYWILADHSTLTHAEAANRHYKIAPKSVDHLEFEHICVSKMQSQHGTLATLE